jgi:hypothetical protein
MTNFQKAVAMTRSDTWNTTTLGKTKKDAYKEFCLEHCPHPSKPCKGDCPEMKAFRKSVKKGGKGNG